MNNMSGAASDKGEWWCEAVLKERKQRERKV